MTLRMLMNRALDTDLTPIIERLAEALLIFTWAILGLTLVGGLILAGWSWWTNRRRRQDRGGGHA